MFKKARGFTIPLSITNTFDPYPHGSPSPILHFPTHNIQNAVQHYDRLIGDIFFARYNKETLKLKSLIYSLSV